MIHILDSQPSVVNRFMAELRDHNIQTDSLRFRYNLRRIGWMLAYQISRTLPTESRHVETPLGSLDIVTPHEANLVIATILRAGLPMFEGMLEVFDHAGTAFISACRKYQDETSFQIEMAQISSPRLEGKVLLLTDTMLATGASMALTYEALCAQRGKPLHTHVACAIASQEGVAFLQERFGDQEMSIWAAAVDGAMNEKAYIVPGLGDAGDLAFGLKE